MKKNQMISFKKKNMKKPSAKVVALLATVMLILTVITLLYQREKPFLPQQLKTAILFPDLSQEEKKDPIFQASLTFLQEKNTVKGYDDGTFKSEKEVNRAEFMKMLVSAVVQEEVSWAKGPCFRDLKGNEWYAKYICHGKEKEWIAGYPDGTCRPENTVNQAEMMKFITVAMAWDPAEVQSQTLPKTANEKEWYAKYARLMIAKNILSENEINPEKLMTRKDVTLALFRAMLIDSLKVNKFQEEKIPDLFKVAKIPFTPESPPTHEAKPSMR